MAADADKLYTHLYTVREMSSSSLPLHSSRNSQTKYLSYIYLSFFSPFLLNVSIFRFDAMQLEQITISRCHPSLLVTHSMVRSLRPHCCFALARRKCELTEKCKRIVAFTCRLLFFTCASVSLLFHRSTRFRD